MLIKTLATHFTDSDPQPKKSLKMMLPVKTLSTIKNYKDIYLFNTYTVRTVCMCIYIGTFIQTHASPEHIPWLMVCLGECEVSILWTPFKPTV